MSTSGTGTPTGQRAKPGYAELSKPQREVAELRLG